jgi:hypothetical protein
MKRKKNPAGANWCGETPSRCSVHPIQELSRVIEALKRRTRQPFAVYHESTSLQQALGVDLACEAPGAVSVSCGSRAEIEIRRSPSGYRPSKIWGFVRSEAQSRRLRVEASGVMETVNNRGVSARPWQQRAQSRVVTLRAVVKTPGRRGARA